MRGGLLETFIEAFTGCDLALQGKAFFMSSGFSDLHLDSARLTMLEC